MANFFISFMSIVVFMLHGFGFLAPLSSAAKWHEVRLIFYYFIVFVVIFFNFQIQELWHFLLLFAKGASGFGACVAPVILRWTRLTGNLRIPLFFDSKKGQFIKIYFIFLLTTRLGECIIAKYFEYSFPKTASVIDIILQSQGLPRKWFVWTFFTLCFSRRKVYF